MIASFASHAAPDDVLVFKKHPLDNGLENWAKVIRTLAAKYDLSDRYYFIDGGDLDRLIKAALGVVVVNSTVGVTALQLGCPVKVTGVSVYDMPGITYQDGLDAFWTKAEAVDQNKVDALIRLLAYSIHEKGNFYTHKGRTAAASGIVARILANRINQGGYELKQSRLALAKRLGIRIDS